MHTQRLIGRNACALSSCSYVNPRTITRSSPVSVCLSRIRARLSTFARRANIPLGIPRRALDVCGIENIVENLFDRW